MRSEEPFRHFQSPPPAEDSNPAASATAFQGFKALAANFTQSPNEIVDLKLSGLTAELRWTLHVLARITIGDAYQRGGSPYDFKSIPWPRWMELLELRSVNAVKTRLARLEEMGLIEVLPGERGPWGTTPNRYRLRWANDGQAASRTFHAVLGDRARQMKRKHQARIGVNQPADSRGSEVHQPPDTPLIPMQQPAATPSADPPALEPSTAVPKQSADELSRLKGMADELTELINSFNRNEIQPARLSASASTTPMEGIHSLEAPADGLAENNSHIDLDLKLKHLLKGMGSGPWPELLFSELAKILSPHQVSVIEQRSPWSAEGAWAILEAIRVMGRGLDRKAATLWNALLKQEKGAGWLAKAGSWSAQMRKASGDGIEPKTGPGSPGCEPEAHENFGCPPWQGESREMHPSWQTQGPRGASGPAPHDDKAPQERKDGMTPQGSTRVKRPEDFSPQMKAQLRSLIEHSRQTLRDFLQDPVGDQRQALDAFSRAFQHAADVLEPVLPVLVTLPDEHRPTEIRQRSQIKTNVLNAVYHAVS